MRARVPNRSFVALILFALLTTAASAQIVHIDSTSNWKKAFKVGINLNQAAFSGNWKAGGINSFGFNALTNFKANYKKGDNSWDNEIDLLYGMVRNSGQGYRKTVDRIFIDSKYGRKLSEKWDFAASMNLVSQFAKGYKYEKDVVGRDSAVLISDSFAPAFITSALGFEYHPTSFFKVRMSPFAPRVTLVRDNQRFVTPTNAEPYGVAPAKVARFEWLAAQVLAEFNKDIAKNVNLKWRYLLFANYETLAFKTIDQRLDFNLTAKVNQLVNVSIGGIMLYDADQDAAVQWSQVFSLGVIYTVQNYEAK